MTKLRTVTVLRPSGTRLGRVVGRTLLWLYVNDGARTTAFYVKTGWERGAKKYGREGLSYLAKEDLRRVTRMPRGAK